MYCCSFLIPVAKVRQKNVDYKYEVIVQKVVQKTKTPYLCGVKQETTHREDAPLWIDDYDYTLTDERIAKYPLDRRDHSKLLLYSDGNISEDRFFNIGNHLESGSLLVYNNTRVIPARLVFHKHREEGDAGGQTGARIEVFCLEPLSPKDYALNLGSRDGCEWKCMIGNLKKWKKGALTLCISRGGERENIVLSAERLSSQGNTHTVRFSWTGKDVSFAEILDMLGELPIPPYLNRKTEESDKTTYQTVYSRIKGSVAAPTAGLHFTDEVLDGLRGRGIDTAELTLHVGAGTFQPVKTADANEHTMHTEIISVSRQTIESLIAHEGRITAVGTTSMRTLESLYYIGCRLRENENIEGDIHVGQFEPYEREYDLKTAEALRGIVSWLDRTGQNTLHAETQIMIKPGYRFRIVSRLITNFHQPRSTLLLLVSAFVGDDWKRIYDYALDNGFRFLSYGDSSLLTKREQ